MRRVFGMVMLVAAVTACQDGPGAIARPDASLDVVRAKRELTRPGRLATTRPVADPGAAFLVHGGNSYYDVFVDDEIAWGQAGLFTVGTGPNHPITIATGERQNVLYGGSYGAPGTTYTTIRSYTSGTDYTQGWAGASPLVRVNLSGFVTSVDPAGGAGFVTTHEVTGRDQMRVVQTVRANGTTYLESSVEVTTEVTNTGSAPLAIGIRYLWDFEIGQDDGPAFYPRNPDSGPVLTEASYPAPPFAFYKLEDNDRNDPSPFFAVFGTNTGPTGVQPAPSGATLIQHAQWQAAYGNAFTYTTDPALIVSTTAAPSRGFFGGDNAVLTFVGESPATAVTIAPGQSFTFSHSIFSAPSDGSPPPFEEPDPPVEEPDPPADPPAGPACTRTVGYWKNHTSNWPLSQVTLGAAGYSAAEALEILDTSPRGDVTIIAAHQLIAAKLNLAAGADAASVAGTVTATDAWLQEMGGVGSGARGRNAGIGTSLADTLDRYNNGQLGPAHCN